MKNNKKKGTGMQLWAVVSVLLVIVLTALTVLENTLLAPILGTVLGGPKPISGPDALDIYQSAYSSKAEATAAGNTLNVEIASEGFVLLVNEDHALPILTPVSDPSVSAKPKISVFGKNSVNLVTGGSGSGGLGGTKAATLYDGLEKGGFEVNPVLKAFYEDHAASGKGRSNNPALSGSSASAPTLDIGETPLTSYTDAVVNSMKDYSDAAVVVISRVGGESFDLPRTQNVLAGGIEGSHYLQLDANEYALLDAVTARFDRVIVLLNTLTPFQSDFIAQYNNTADSKRIDAVMWIGGPGSTGMEAIGGLLSGAVNPSGKTVDIWAADYTQDPTWQNFGDGSQVFGGLNNTAFLENGAPIAGQNMVTYEEGIYVGYRYYETRDAEERRADSVSTWYQDHVVFPFGYGLTYTAFDQKITQVTGSLSDEDPLSIQVTSTNTGKTAGKDVIELYVTKPYTYGGIEKSSVELVDFAKTPVLQPGESWTTVFTIQPYSLASYDYNDANANGFVGYELEQGDYVFSVSADSHVAEHSFDQTMVLLNAAIRYASDPVTGEAVVNRYTTDDYTDLQYRLSDVNVIVGDAEITRKGMSRTDFAGTFPTPLNAEEREVKSEELNGQNELQTLRSFAHNNPWIDTVTKMPPTNETVSGQPLKIRDLLDEEYQVDYDDPRWEALLDRLTFAEMKELVNYGAFETRAIPSIGKNLTNDSDGPIGWVNFMVGKSESYTGNATFACEIVIASTWNKDLAYQMGRIVGENGLYGDENGNHLPYSGWYAPAVNLHRSPFAGRNFEYYSEDPVLSGKLAVNVINGAASKGVYTDLKHLALNDQETNRAGVSTFCTEQALRELFLKPFEMAVKGMDDPSQVPSAAADGVDIYRGTVGIMSSFNRIGTRWTGGDYRLLGDILRGEWGYRGLVICDYKTDNSYMDARQMLYAGNDLILTSLTNLMWENPDPADPKDVTILRTAAKNILYTFANSNSVGVDIVGYSMEWWKLATMILDCVVVLGLGLWGWRVFRKKKNA